MTAPSASLHRIPRYPHAWAWLLMLSQLLVAAASSRWGWTFGLPLMLISHAPLWWGTLSAVIGFVVPLLFRLLPSKPLAGHAAAGLFTAQAWVSLGCGALLLLVLRGRAGEGRDARARTTLSFVMAGMLLALLIEYVAAPHIRARENLALWHGAGTAMYALQWLCAVAVLWRQTHRA